MQTKELNYNGKKIVYRTKGEGPEVMLLHGFGEDGSIWKGQYGLFPDHKLIVPDLPGSGGSEMINDMSMEGLASAIESIASAEGAKDSGLYLVGHSMGGYITLAFAEKYPDRLRGLGLFHSTAYADSDEKKETRRKAIRFMEENGAAEFLKTATPNLYAPQSREQHPEWIEEHIAATGNFSAAALVHYYMAMIQRPDRTDILRNSTVPVLFVLGRHDTAVSLQDGLQQCYLPQIAYIHVFEHSGHMGMIEEPTKANKVLTQFVNTTENTA